MARRVGPSIVRVEGPDGLSHGFVFGSDRFVVAPLGVVQAARGLVVVAPNGDRRRPRVAVTDPDHDLALLELASPITDAAPLSPSPSKIERGTTVLAFGATDLGGLADAVTLGTISRVQGDRFQASARTSFHATWGSPLVDCEGRVVGVASTWAGGEALRVGVVRALVDRAASPSEYTPGWSMAHPSAGTLLSLGTDLPWLGGYLGVSAVGEDRYELSLRAGAAARIDVPKVGQLSYDQQAGVRVMGDARFGYRALLNEGFLGVYLVPTIGVVGGWQRTWVNQVRQRVAISSCPAGSSCPVESETTKRDERDRLWLAPVLGAALRFGPGEIGYSLELDPRKPAASLHTITFGLQF